ncbi:hypothetical protein [Hyalangium gracile]|uniref:hypothetical protein n=1 Tax=Hyalangium gracile TaxID=394092 RepID=UPI001CCE646A|nr:hypothetical protein [Hyalangium gracile]
MKLSSVVCGLLLGVAGLGWSGCANNAEVVEEKPPDAAKLSEYYPLAVGNTWTYALDGRTDRQEQVKILKQEEGFFHDNKNGQLMVDSFGIRDEKRYLLRAPLEPGRTWTNVVSVSSTERYEILHVGIPCQVPAGSFQNCVQVEARNRVDAKATLINTFTFAPGVGLVRIQMEVEHDGRRIPQTRLELTSYQVNPGQG